VKRAARNVIGAGALERDVALDHVHDIDAVEQVLPEDRTTITITSPTETTRTVMIMANGPRSERLVRQLG
jgi:hypothetical protein